MQGLLMPDKPHNARAALGLLESLLILLVEKKVLSAEELDETFDVAINAFREAAEAGENGDNLAAARLLERVQRSGNAVTRP